MRLAQKLWKDLITVDDISAAWISVASFCALQYQHTEPQMNIQLRKHLSGKQAVHISVVDDTRTAAIQTVTYDQRQLNG